MEPSPPLRQVEQELPPHFTNLETKCLNQHGKPCVSSNSLSSVLKYYIMHYFYLTFFKIEVNIIFISNWRYFSLWVFWIYVVINRALEVYSGNYSCPVLTPEAYAGPKIAPPSPKELTGPSPS